MSETLSVETAATYETEIRAYDPEAYATEGSDNKEIQDPTWGHELFDLVSANADEIVRCPWMDGAKVSLGDAMTAYNYPPNMTAADEPFLVSVVNDLLTNRRAETEEIEMDETESENFNEEVPVIEEEVKAMTEEKEPNQKQEKSHIMKPLFE